ncbi:MAG TPA: flagellar hook capping FlgD N-terminal domain-containing protein [Planctomycetota bacterium]|nr:flagellar hook capping FlgD N-terminal domain-containing protein [Planctomycetota bacterium]
MNNTTISNIGLNSGALNASGTQKKTPDSESFLQLMIAQLQAQTPLEPVDNDRMLEQMSNFSSMEQQQKLNSNLTTLLEFQSILARLDGLSQGSAWIGKEVDYVGQDNKTQSGTVESVRIDEHGQTLVKVSGKEVPIATIIGVRGAKSSDSDSAADSK